MIHTIRPRVAAAALSRLRARPVHPHFAGYLHLLAVATKSRSTERLNPAFKNFFDRFFLVPGHPLGAPYIKPFERTASASNEWLNRNVAGSYAISSIRDTKSFGRVISTSAASYSLRPQHATLALEHLLDGTPLSIVDLVLFLYRDFGLCKATPSIDDLIGRFAADFGFATPKSPDYSLEFFVLFEDDRHGFSEVQWTEALQEPPEGTTPRVGANGVTRDPVRRLTAGQLLGEDDANDVRSPKPTLMELSIKGLLSFRDFTTLQFGNLNLLVGPNGSGKSNILNCLRILAEAPTDIQSAFRDGFEAWIYSGVNKDPEPAHLEAVVRLPHSDTIIRHQLRLGPPLHSRARLDELIELTDANRSEPLTLFTGSYRSSPSIAVGGSGKRRREVEFPANEYNPFSSILAQVRDAGQYPELTKLGDLYSGVRIYSEWTFGTTSRLRQSASASRSDSRLSESMDDLPIALNAIRQSEAHQKLVSLLSEVKDTYKDFDTRLHFGRVGLEIIESGLGLPVPAGRLSDGTLRFLALAVVLVQPTPSPVICIEEPELGMHPDMIRVIARMIIEAASRTQVFITTHSELLLTTLQDDFDVMFTFGTSADGSVVRTFDKRAFKEWRGEHSLGELWTSGELGGNRW